jgi:hypothetical protein
LPCDYATPGPWIEESEGLRYQAGISVADPRTTTGYRRIAYMGAPGSYRLRPQHVKKATFIAQARTDVPALVAEIERLWALIGSIERLCGLAKITYPPRVGAVENTKAFPGKQSALSLTKHDAPTACRSKRSDHLKETCPIATAHEFSYTRRDNNIIVTLRKPL